MTRKDALENAIRITTEDRNNQYGSPENSFADIANLWNAYLDKRLMGDLSPADVAAMMVLFKVARLKFAKKDDTWIDAAGYAGIGAELSEEE